MNEEALLIVNPRSGVDRNKETMIETASRLCESHGMRLNIEFTSGPGDGRKIAEEGSRRGYGLVIAAGGDGTVRDVADGLWKTSTAMGIVPMGSGNGLARSLGISQEESEALVTAITGQTITIDRGLANGGSFYSAFGVGFDAEVSYRFAQDKRRGRSTYIKHALRQILSYKPRRFRLTYGHEISIETEALLIAACNCMQYGNNAYISPKADPTDGLLDITVVHQGNFLSTAIAGIDLFMGRLDHNVLVQMFRTKGIVITMEGADHCITHLDGEPEQTSPEVHICCERGGLMIRIPKGLPPFKPILSPMKSMWDDMLGDIRKNLQS